MMLSLSSCNSNKTDSESNVSQTIYIPTTESEIIEETVAPEKVKETIVGAWAYERIISPRVFYDEIYDPEITKTYIKMRFNYVINSDGTLQTNVSIVNEALVIKEYKALVVSMAQKQVESQGKTLSEDDISLLESQVEKTLKEVSAIKTGTYKINDNQIVLTINGETNEKDFELTENTLTIKDMDGSSTKLIRQNEL